MGASFSDERFRQFYARELVIRLAEAAVVIQALARSFLCRSHLQRKWMREAALKDSQIRARRRIVGYIAHKTKTVEGASTSHFAREELSTVTTLPSVGGDGDSVSSVTIPNQKAVMFDVHVSTGSIAQSSPLVKSEIESSPLSPSHHVATADKRIDGFSDFIKKYCVMEDI